MENNKETPDTNYEDMTVIKNLYNKTMSNYQGADKGTVLEEWIKYSDKIKNGTITVHDYTNLLEDSDYLLNFLERTSEVYGPSRGGNSNHYMLFRNLGGEKKSGKIIEKGSYYISGKISPDKNDIEQTDDMKIVKKAFDDYIKPLLKAVNEAKTIKELSTLEEKENYKDFKAKQILRKMVVLNSLRTDTDDYKDIRNKLLFIYQDETINNLYKELKLVSKSEKEPNYYEKNMAILEKANEILGNEDAEDKSEKDPIKNIDKKTSFLWKYVNATNIVTKDSPNVIFYGAPGTGKTHEVEEAISFLCKGKEKYYKKIQLHPGFTYEDFIEGIKPVGLDKNGNIKFQIVNGVFKQFCIDAKKEPDKNFYFIADEINRANLSALFGETLSLLERDYRQQKDGNDYINTKNLRSTALSTAIREYVKENNPDFDNDGGFNKDFSDPLVYQFDENGNVLFGIPDNVFFIGMMNDVDKSIDSFDLALRRRFKWIRKECDYDVIRDNIRKNNVTEYIEACKKLNEMISNTFKLGISYQFGHSFFLCIKEAPNHDDNNISDNDMQELFTNYLEPTLTEYLRAFYDESEITGKIKEAKKVFVINGDKK